MRLAILTYRLQSIHLCISTILPPRVILDALDVTSIGTLLCGHSG